MSARPGLCGGQPAMAVPTAIANHSRHSTRFDLYVAIVLSVTPTVGLRRWDKGSYKQPDS
jgi:hypothetical protein